MSRPKLGLRKREEIVAQQVGPKFEIKWGHGELTFPASSLRSWQSVREPRLPQCATGQRHRLRMSRKGDCWDNAVVESFFATLKKELIHRRPWPTVRRAREAIAEYIELFYNSRRMHSTLGYISPVEFENRFDQEAALAA